MNLIEAQFSIRDFGQVRLETDFQMAPQGVTALFGPSGAGKSTLLHSLAGLISPEHSVGTRIETSQGTWQDPSRFVKPEDRGVGMKCVRATTTTSHHLASLRMTFFR